MNGIGKIEQLTETNPSKLDCETCKKNLKKTYITIERHNEIQIQTNETYIKEIKVLKFDAKILETTAKKHLTALKELEKEFDAYKKNLRKKLLQDFPYGVYCKESVKSVLDENK